VSLRAPTLLFVSLVSALFSAALGCGPVSAPLVGGAAEAGDCVFCPLNAGDLLGQAAANSTEGASPDAGCDGEECSAFCGPARYPGDTVHSPLPCVLAERLRAFRAAHPERDGAVFMKVGDSISATHEFLHCFETEALELEQTGHEHLAAAHRHFRAGRIGETTPYDRQSLAAEVGQTASWALEGAPSPFAKEASATNAAYSLIMFGTNDMNYRGAAASPLEKFPWMARHLRAVVDESLEQGVLPVLYAIPPYRGLEPLVTYLTPSYNAIVRALAESRQIPLVDYYTPMLALPDAGLRDDGVHPSADYVRLCNFDEEGLRYGYNLRNLLTLEVLDRLWQVTRAHDPVLGLEAPSLPPLAGTGSLERPFVVPASDLPFADLRLPTTGGAEAALAGGCETEGTTRRVAFRISLAEDTPLRVLAIGFGGAAVRLVVDSAAPAPACPAEAALISGQLAAGVHDLVVEAAVPVGGEALLLLAPCHADDPRCR
jgi:hypothetical protein